MRFILISLLLLFSFSVHAAEDDPAFALSFGPVLIGEERIKIDLSEFPLLVEGATAPVEAKWIEESVQWVRLKNNLMLPRARMKIVAKVDASRISLQYLDKVISLQGADGVSETELYFSLFHPGIIQVYVDGKPSGKIVLRAMSRSKTNEKRHLIDYSCAPWLLEVKGVDNEFISVSCQMIRVGKMGEEYPMLEVYWSAVNVKMLDGRTPPFTAVFRDNKTVSATVIGSQGEKKIVEISAKVPLRMHRLKFAGGLGPYQFVAQKDLGTKKTGYAPSLMLYGNFWLTDEMSIRGFDAAVLSDPTSRAFFNNFGVYFAYEIGRALDKRVQILALLGFQGVTFAYDGLKGITFSQAIFPQGFEMTYMHAFGMKNYLLGGGMFLFPSGNNPYKNVWVRFGKRTFGEINYISWGNGELAATMWGLSVGFPLNSWF